MKKLDRVLRVVQEIIIKNSPGSFKSRVGEANEVFSRLLNTHKCLVEGGMEILKRVDAVLTFQKVVLSQRTPTGLTGRNRQKEAPPPPLKRGKHILPPQARPPCKLENSN